MVVANRGYRRKSMACCGAVFREPAIKTSFASRWKTKEIHDWIANMGSRPRGRPPKFSSDVVKEKLLDAARMTLTRTGIDNGLDSVSLDRAIAIAEVPRGSAYKMWHSDIRSPQEEFRTAVVVDLLRMPASAGLPATRTFVESEIERLHDQIHSNDDAERMAAFREMIRTVGEFNHQRLRDSLAWRIYVALRSAATTRPDTDPEIWNAITNGEEFMIEEYSTLYNEMADLFKMRIKPDFEVNDFSTALFVLNEGLGNRVGANFREGGISRTTGPGGERQDWTLFAITFDALVEYFWEPNS